MSDSGALYVDGDDVHEKISDRPLGAGRRRIMLVGFDTGDDRLQTTQGTAVPFDDIHAVKGKRPG